MSGASIPIDIAAACLVVVTAGFFLIRYAGLSASLMMAAALNIFKCGNRFLDVHFLNDVSLSSAVPSALRKNKNYY